MAKPPVCKLMDYGKFKYETAQKAREARRNQTHTVIKEMKLRPKIDNHDYETKKGHIERFLGQGDKVKVTIMFRGREQSRPELGFRCCLGWQMTLNRWDSLKHRPTGWAQHDHGAGTASEEIRRPRARNRGLEETTCRR